MSEFYPFFTNDGSVGLYSKEDDDIYHSAYGALTESWDKFITPSCLKQLIDSNKDIKILDICYGIGYNTKCALQFYINEIIRKNKKNILNKIFFKIIKNIIILFYNFKNFSKKIISSNNNTYAIHTDNIYTYTTNNETIDTDNVSNNNFNNIIEIQYKKIHSNKKNDSAIYSDNILDSKISKYCMKKKFKIKLLSNLDKFIFNIMHFDDIDASKILIDAVDIDSSLIKFSPLITNKLKFSKLKFRKNNKNTSKLEQIKYISSLKREKICKSQIISDTVSMIIAKNLIDNNHLILNDEKIKNFIKERKNKQFISKNLLNFVKFYSNIRYYANLNNNKSTLLHNIYYQYISRSYKLVEKFFNFNLINLNFAAIDARKYILSSNSNYNIIFLDAFTPSKCPTLWTIDFLQELYNRLESDGMLLTYSNSAAVRNALLNAGFYIGKIFDDKHKKFVGTVAVKNMNLIKYNLDEKDIALINSKAGIFYKDNSLNNDVKYIIEKRQYEFDNSSLPSSSKSLKGLKHETKL